MTKVSKETLLRAIGSDQMEDFKPHREVYMTEVQTEILARARMDARDISEFLGASVPFALKRVHEMVQSEDEGIATKNAHYMIDHLIGKAVQRSHNTNTNINIDVIAD